ncbi:hypothetical protein QBC46DRAFT_72177 [Diplogelasinospora grovesii]|uniref:Rhodopsin domain-containing protein n=1 Tax=Diplogelasinospora grovesii TaxID=303347 RepID=A0AAN6S748_9PEZI|nr:hypothetical protein QBC46DRAFT_72177 [Diplogelasinospora grovesii]
MSSPSIKPILISNLHESYQANIIACAAISWAVGATFVALRFYTRGRLLQNVLGTEDWFILVALVFSGATCAGMIEQAVYGLGKHALDLDPALRMPMARAGWYTILWYMMALLFTKISILMLYIRILGYQHARYAAYAIMTIVILTNVWTFVTVMTSCIPLQAFWDPSIPDSYCRPASYWFANTGLHIGTDVLLYILPLPVIFNLQVKRRQKVALYSIFALGFFVCSISVVRLFELIEEYTHFDFTYDNVAISYLTVIEVNAAIACACMMTLKPLISKIFPRLFWGTSSRPDSPPKDVEAAAAAAAAAGGRPLTIGSKPSRAAQKRPSSSWTTRTLHERAHSDSPTLLGDGYDDLMSGLASPTDSEHKLLPLREPPAAHVMKRETDNMHPESDRGAETPLAELFARTQRVNY